MRIVFQFDEILVADTFFFNAFCFPCPICLLSGHEAIVLFSTQNVIVLVFIFGFVIYFNLNFV